MALPHGYLLIQIILIDTFDDFPNAPSGLINDVNYIYIPDGAITGCNLYKYVNMKLVPHLDCSKNNYYLTISQDNELYGDSRRRVGCV